MTQQNNERPAFPQAINPAEHGRGMTLRDYFAAKAMQGFAVDPDMADVPARDISKLAYKWADEMLKAREK